MEIQANRLSISENLDSDYIQIIFSDESGKTSLRDNTDYPYLLLQRSFEFSGPYYLECRNHDLCGHGEIKQLILKRSGVQVELRRSDLSHTQRTIHVYRQFTSEELLKVKEVLEIIVSDYPCFVDET